MGMIELTSNFLMLVMVLSHLHNTEGQAITSTSCPYNPIRLNCLPIQGKTTLINIVSIFTTYKMSCPQGESFSDCDTVLTNSNNFTKKILTQCHQQQHCSTTSEVVSLGRICASTIYQGNYIRITYSCEFPGSIPVTQDLPTTTSTGLAVSQLNTGGSSMSSSKITIATESTGSTSEERKDINVPAIVAPLVLLLIVTLIIIVTTLLYRRRKLPTKLQWKLSRTIDAITQCCNGDDFDPRIDGQTKSHQVIDNSYIHGNSVEDIYSTIDERVDNPPKTQRADTYMEWPAMSNKSYQSNQSELPKILVLERKDNRKPTQAVAEVNRWSDDEFDKDEHDQQTNTGEAALHTQQQEKEQADGCDYIPEYLEAVSNDIYINTPTAANILQQVSMGYSTGASAEGARDDTYMYSDPADAQTSHVEDHFTNMKVQGQDKSSTALPQIKPKVTQKPTVAVKPRLNSDIKKSSEADLHKPKNTALEPALKPIDTIELSRSMHIHKPQNESEI